MSFIHPKNVRTADQAEIMDQIAEDGVCPFCPENLSRYHKEPIHEEGTYWILTENQWPYEGAKIHLFAIAKNHIELIEELSPEASAELFELFKRGAKKFGIVGGTVAMRFGPTIQYASSVKHLHAHFIEPDVQNPDHPGIKFPVSKPSSTQQKES